MTREELAQYDGREGRKAYVAVNGRVYDFTASKLWQQGDHQGQHQAGTDLTEALKDAPHVRAVIERFAVVGEIEKPQEQVLSKNKTPMIIAGLLIIGVVLAVLFLR